MRLAWLCGLLTVISCDEIEQTSEGEPCNEYEGTADCEDGVRYCDAVGEDDALQWGQCVSEPICELGESEACTFDDEFGGGTGSRHCILHDGEPAWDDSVYFEAGCNTPLVLSFDGAPVRMEAAPAATFDIDGAGACISTDWPTSVTPWLALDIDRDGVVDSGAELFGSGTHLRSGSRASNGFEALAALDSNGDGRISSADERFADLVLWSDVDGDKRGVLGELDPLATRGILSIALDYAIDRRCDDRGNCEVERARFEYIDAGGELRHGDVVDIHLACQ
jgi:hypothetical protein